MHYQANELGAVLPNIPLSMNLNLTLGKESSPIFAILSELPNSFNGKVANYWAKYRWQTLNPTQVAQFVCLNWSICFDY